MTDQSKTIRTRGYAANVPLHEFVCPGCGEKVTRISTAKHCSPKCRKRVWAKRINEKYPGVSTREALRRNTSDKIGQPHCDYCGQPLPMDTKQVYCNDKCRKAASRARDPNFVRLKVSRARAKEAAKFVIEHYGTVIPNCPEEWLTRSKSNNKKKGPRAKRFFQGAMVNYTRDDIRAIYTAYPGALEILLSVDRI